MLLALIRTIRFGAGSRLAVGVYSDSPWQGEKLLQIGELRWRVAQCNSALELRQCLIEESDQPLVLVTPLLTTDVGDDVRARLFRQQVMSVDPWTSLAARFKVTKVDPAVRQTTALAEAALDALGNDETPGVPSGILTADPVWQVVLRNRLGLKPAEQEFQGTNSWRPDLLDFLPWMTIDGSAARWHALGTALKEQLEAWLSLGLGDLGAVLIRSLTDGYGVDALAIGLALGALGAANSESRAMGRMERFTGNQPLTGSLAKSWNQAAEQWVRRAEMDRARSELGRADQILQSVGAITSAVNSGWSPVGFEMRLSSFAQAITSSDDAICQQAYALVASHEGSQYLEELRGRRQRAEMAMRLVRWLRQPKEQVSQLPKAISNYERDSSWVDWARQQLLNGDESELVARAYRKLFNIVTDRREEENRRFGQLLVESTLDNATSPKVLLIEDVIKTLVVPLLRDAPVGVLFIAMDGMSLPVWRELSVDLLDHGWTERVPVDGPSYRSALTVIPSVTGCSRASLLCGKLISGGQSIEKRGFQDHVDLRSSKPQLFHKDEVGSSGADLSEALRTAVGRGDLKLVGAVLNVIDDSLSGPEQLAIQWSLRSIPVLRTLLSEARNSGRVVVLASDHGHVLQHDSMLLRHSECADRWCPVENEANLSADERMISGHRVLAPISETIRYTANRRLGYHGGLTPQECVAPVAVLAPGIMNLDGWDVQAADVPEWWFESEPRFTEEPLKRQKRGRSPLTATPEPLLFEAPLAQRDWIAALLNSEVFSAQMETFAGRLTRGQVEHYLRVLADRNLVLIRSAFAEKVGLSNLRVDGLIASLQRILNVEGYLVLSMDSSQTIRLHLPLLREQFELGDPDGC